MVRVSSTSHIKRARKEAALYRIVSAAVAHIMRDNSQIHDIFPTKVLLSPDGGSCRVYFHAPAGEAFFDEQVGQLMLYKPSIRALISQEMPRRHTPEIVFVFDKTFAKIERLEELIARVSDADNEHN